MDRHSREMRAIERALLDVLSTEMPDAIVAFDPWHGGAITIGRSPRMRDRAFALLAHTNYVNLWLWDGARLPDPGGMITGGGAKIRHVSVRDLRQARSRPLRDIVRAQVACLETRKAA